jgi:hypothetical protein
MEGCFSESSWIGTIGFFTCYFGEKLDNISSGFVEEMENNREECRLFRGRCFLLRS